MTRRLSPVLAAAFLLLLPTQAIAQQAACRTVRAMTNADRRNFADFSIAVSSGALTLRAGSRAADLGGPAQCEVASENVHRSIACRWRFFDRAQATAFYEPLLTRLRTCLVEAMPEAEIATRNEDRVMLRRHEALLGAEYSQTRVELSLFESTVGSRFDPSPGRNHHVQLVVEYEQGD